MLPPRFVLLALAALALPLAGAAQTVAGTARDASTGTPIATAEVAVLGEGGAIAGLAITDSAGGFRIRLAGPGRYRVVGNVLGYDSVSVDSLMVAPEEQLTLELLFGARPVALEGVRVVARRGAATGLIEDFFYRADRYEKTGIGFVLDREKLEAFRGYDMTRALLSSTGIIDQTFSGGIRRLTLKAREIRIGKGPFCDPAFFLNGLPVEEAAVQGMPATDLEGIEVYRGVSQVPSTYLRSGAATECGVVLVWLRSH